MSLEAIKQVTQTEQDSLNRRNEAAAAAKRAVTEAERYGKQHLQEARTMAESQVRDLMVKAEEQAAGHTEKVLADKQKACDTLRQKAEGRLDEAAALIVRRVVNS